VTAAALVLAASMLALDWKFWRINEKRAFVGFSLSTRVRELTKQHSLLDEEKCVLICSMTSMTHILNHHFHHSFFSMF
jgi:uncharacterized protein YfbU (UPF0304 family)